MIEKNIHLYKISNTETFNKFLLTIASSSFPILWYFIKEGKGWINGFKISLALFGVSLFMNMLALIITCDYPEPKGCLDKFIYILDWLAFVIFTVALILTYYAIFLI